MKNLSIHSPVGLGPQSQYIGILTAIRNAIYLARRLNQLLMRVQAFPEQTEQLQGNLSYFQFPGQQIKSYKSLLYLTFAEPLLTGRWAVLRRCGNLKVA